MVSARFITLMADPGGRTVLIRGSAAARMLALQVRIPPVAWMFVVSVVCCQVEVSATS